ncbi:hypothetical protein H4Q26_003961 [Puccinia striiformis f. sp. tritici PST-130]|nr:hypothetical protein H4Q26_003961 [Puccinia striiformis f. sp. tritici PST-130]
MDPRVKKANNQTTAPLSTMAETQSESSTETRSSSEPTLRIDSVSAGTQNSSSAKLCRKKSEKGRRSISALVIEAGKNEPWCAGFGKKTFTPACPLDCTASPLCMLSSSTSGSSTHSRTSRRGRRNIMGLPRWK